MNSFSSDINQKLVLEVNWADRWQIYQRLSELDIPCCCEINQPLRVEVAHPSAAIQLWSVTRRFIASRQDLIDTLENCWQMRCQNS
ncbi:MAG TPA: hypothetical protein VK184_25890 [Nostocaceae cyanobacterium]|nr:hypothetical protein [Nostocaceae cyanobacterium]